MQIQFFIEANFSSALHITVNVSNDHDALPLTCLVENNVTRGLCVHKPDVSGSFASCHLY